MSLRSAVPRLLLLSSVAFLGACGLATRAHDEASPDVGGQVITAETIRRSGLSNGWDVLRRYANYLSFSEHEARPLHVSRRGRESIYLTERMLLVLDGARMADVRMLADIPARDISLIRILSGAEASVRYGINAASGVIVVDTDYPPPAPADTAGLRWVGIR